MTITFTVDNKPASVDAGPDTPPGTMTVLPN
jgi:hypothetical protein